MADRVTKSRKEIMDLFKLEAKKLDICNSIYIGPVNAQAPDKTGCNWVLCIGGGEKGQARECARILEQFNTLLRSKYNIPVED